MSAFPRLLIARVLEGKPWLGLAEAMQPRAARLESAGTKTCMFCFLAVTQPSDSGSL